MKRFQILLTATLLAATGCSSMDLVSRKLDIASEHITTDKPIYEGRVKSSEKIGALTAVQFTDNKEFDVSDCNSEFMPGDTVRVYKIDNGYAAHLWRASQTQQL